MYTVFAEMYRRSGLAHRAAMLLPLLAVISIAGLSLISFLNPELCVPIHLLQYWIQALTNVVAAFLFWLWQREEFRKVAVRLVDEGKLSVVRADPQSGGIVVIVKGRRSIQTAIRFRGALQILAIAFPFILPLTAEPLAQRMCSEARVARELIELIPIELVGLFVCMFFIAVAWLFQWGGEGYAIAESLIARTLERGKRQVR